MTDSNSTVSHDGETLICLLCDFVFLLSCLFCWCDAASHSLLPVVWLVQSRVRRCCFRDTWRSCWVWTKTWPPPSSTVSWTSWTGPSPSSSGWSKRWANRRSFSWSAQQGDQLLSNYNSLRSKEHFILQFEIRGLFTLIRTVNGSWHRTRTLCDNRVWSG